MADKKVIILVSIGVVLAGVGVFQFTKSGPDSTPRPKPAKEKNTEQAIPKPDPKVGDMALAGPSKDPFMKPAGVGDGDPKGVAKGGRVPGPMNAAGNPKFPISKQDKGPTEALGGGPLPPLGGTKGSGGAPQIATKEMLNGCGWEVTGIVMGPVPVVVMKNEQGVQALAREGQTVDGNVKVLKISSHGVKVVNKANKKTVNLGIGGGKID